MFDFFVFPNVFMPKVQSAVGVQLLSNFSVAIKQTKQTNLVVGAISVRTFKIHLKIPFAKPAVGVTLQ